MDNQKKVKTNITNGLRFLFYSDGGREECNYKDGKRHGECMCYDINGDKELQAYFFKGKPCNVWMQWDKKGNFDFIDMDIIY